MALRTCSHEPRRKCTKCGTITDRLGCDPVTGAVGIPLCSSCAEGDMTRLCFLLATLSLVMVWMM